MFVGLSSLKVLGAFSLIQLVGIIQLFWGSRAVGPYPLPGSQLLPIFLGTWLPTSPNWLWRISLYPFLFKLQISLTCLDFDLKDLCD